MGQGHQLIMPEVDQAQAALPFWMEQGYQLIMPVLDEFLVWMGQEYQMIMPMVDQAQAALLIWTGQECGGITEPCGRICKLDLDYVTWIFKVSQCRT